MRSVKEVVDEAAKGALADGQFGDPNERSQDMADGILRAAEAEGYSREEVEEALGQDLGDYCDQQQSDAWPDDGTRSDD